jgi:hypothetical protein
VFGVDYMFLEQLISHFVILLMRLGLEHAKQELLDDKSFL